MCPGSENDVGFLIGVVPSYTVVSSGVKLAMSSLVTLAVNTLCHVEVIARVNRVFYNVDTAASRTSAVIW
ncbi:hypothetical protein ACOMHN_000686 [Nucella lapillus]